MPSKPTQNVWYELWEEAGSRGLDTWHMLKGTGSVRNSDYPTFPGPIPPSCFTRLCVCLKINLPVSAA